MRFIFSPYRSYIYTIKTRILSYSTDNETCVQVVDKQKTQPCIGWAVV